MPERALGDDLMIYMSRQSRPGGVAKGDDRVGAAAASHELLDDRLRVLNSDHPDTPAAGRTRSGGGAQRVIE
jgi:hypothetical protein